ncbi:MAG: glucose-6-phosphate isomerase [Bacteroidota bacterium]|nr:glucose-6-phosphate isomerase [Bacteroidota bacterium]
MKLNLDNLTGIVDYEQFALAALEQNRILHQGSGVGNEFLGWVDLPEKAKNDVPRIIEVSKRFKKNLDCIVIIGIGGSYLGTKAVLTALRPHISLSAQDPEILFAGHHLNQEYHTQLFNYLKSRNWGIVIISKSGTTTEPAIAFRFLRSALLQQFGQEESRKRILAITDANKGALRSLADKEGYESFIIPDDVGGRFSILTPVGLVPLALAGIDIEALVQGAYNLMKQSNEETSFSQNLSAQYAAARYALYQQGKGIEILSNFNPALHDVAEWWKQLYGESEGKDQKGIFPASVDLTTDLHSMGQFIQDGTRQLFETAVLIKESDLELILEKQDSDLDQLNYLTGKSMDYVNKQAAEGTLLAHKDGAVPIIRIEIDNLSAYTLGELFYFFEKACGISGYLLGVNPFDQPGVEAYKKNMFALLGKPGYGSQNT